MGEKGGVYIQGSSVSVAEKDLDALCVAGFSTLSCSFQRKHSATRLKVAAKTDVIKKKIRLGRLVGLHPFLSPGNSRLAALMLL